MPTTAMDIEHALETGIMTELRKRTYFATGGEACSHIDNQTLFAFKIPANIASAGLTFVVSDAPRLVCKGNETIVQTL